MGPRADGAILRAVLRGLAILWAGPGTLAGLALLLIARCSGGSVCRREGALEVCGGALVPLMKRLGSRSTVVLAMTLGHVILARDAACLDEYRGHERAHVRQWERWGLFFLPAYWLAFLWGRLRGADPYLENPFEREARRSERRFGGGPPRG